ncbi:hypothetical protein Ais01nite_13810 [Asanoa ishikariensis]|uniref:Putative glutathione S-transferase n=1 Tax=Asanoa ishikariensis TaxID=137265 RepID=A0A1H3UL18_9ACTN|nr:glutathione S-transferase C-terminal domain-containing protein [Asanoa ishikariensis]GIF63346.1 hypothetical protein Ais01nite_13810 [Asanoa ishikariensis]SDZ62535.1 putative glutathione S-transferase [Asanoa ishikariensis]
MALPLASPADTAVYGSYRFDTSEPRYRFGGRIAPDGPFPPEPGRYHVYAGWFCPWSHRVTITRALTGLTHVVSVSYVDNERDGRGWAFRESYGPDPVNGFTLLREAYEATEPGFTGLVSVPTLWDRATRQVVSNTHAAIEVDLATRFDAEVDVFPVRLRAEIEALDDWIGPAINHGVAAATTAGPAGTSARAALLDAFARLDERLATQPFLVGDTVTLADIRLWVTLVRYDVGPNADRAIHPGLPEFPHLWAYARRLYTLPAFRDTTDFAAFTRPGAEQPDWTGVSA